MKENKFRGKRIDDGQWVYGYLIGNDVIVGPIVEWDSEYFNTEFWSRVDPKTVGQFSGLHDDHEDGNELFHGDIVVLDHEGKEIRCVVQYQAPGFLLVSDDFEDGFVWMGELVEYDRDYAWLSKSQMVGNIHGEEQSE